MDQRCVVKPGTVIPTLGFSTGTGCYYNNYDILCCQNMNDTVLSSWKNFSGIPQVNTTSSLMFLF